MERFRLHETKDYSVFEFFECNRDVDPSKVVKLVNSIKKYGLTSPIIVSNDGNVIDGQHRLNALIRLQLPVPYLVINNHNIEQLSEINTIQSKWSLADYVKFSAKRGNLDCQNLLDTFDKYEDISNSLITLIFGDDKKNRLRDIRSGQYSFNRVQGEEFLRSLKGLESTVDKSNIKRIYSNRFVNALKSIIKNNSHFDFNRLINAAKNKPLRFYDNVDDNKDRIVEVYNNRIRGRKLKV